MSTFQQTLENLKSEHQTAPLLQSFHEKAWGHFMELGLPSKQEEAYRYIKLRDLYSQTFVSPKPSNAPVNPKKILPGCEQSLITFVNGVYSPALSNTKGLGKAAVHTLEEAAASFGSFLGNQWAKSAKQESDPFAALNRALGEKGAFLYIPPNTALEAPIQVHHIIDGEGIHCLPRLQLFLGKGGEAGLIHTLQIESGESCFINDGIEATIEEGAHLRYSQIFTDLPDSAWCFSSFRASQKRDSTLNAVSATDGSKTVRNDWHVQLTGENSEANLNGLWKLDGKREAHAYVLIDHQAPNCRSRQLFKGVLNGTSRSSFEGKILVQQAAQQTDAFQLNNNLLLSDLANADSKPNLEIFADDVKASHGATIGQLDPEQLFYLKSRGFSDTRSKEILVKGFCQEITDMLPIRGVLSC